MQIRALRRPSPVWGPRRARFVPKLWEFAEARVLGIGDPDRGDVMRRRILGLIAAIVAGLAIGVPAASAAWRMTIEARDIGGTSTPVDVGNDGFGSGDYALFEDQLEVTRVTPGLGSLSSEGQLQGRLTFQSPPSVSVEAFASLGHGRLRLSGSFDPASGELLLRVDGQGGIFQGARGKALVTLGDSGASLEFFLAMR